MMKPRVQVFISSDDLYYLQSIHRQLEETRKSMRDGPTIGTEVLADNCDWLAGFNETLKTFLDSD